MQINENTAARLTHEVNRAWCRINGDDSQPAWEDAPEWQRGSALNGVRAIRDGRVTRPQESHESWMAEKTANGWTYGPTKDPALKQHPCMVPFEDLPPEQQVKDFLFFNTVKACG